MLLSHLDQIIASVTGANSAGQGPG